MEPQRRRSTSDLVRSSFAAYESKDRKALEELLSDDFRFTSPLDDYIDKKVYFERCWPFSDKVRNFHLLKLFDYGSEAFVLYECEPKVGDRFRNTEFFKIEGNKIKEVQVFFGSLPEETQKK
jgi:hypothetical protein